jgi:gliding motility-associated-like protein
VSGSTFPVGTTTIEYTATDAAGNESTCSFDIVVEDTEAPTISCPADIVLLIPNGDCDITLTYADPVADDNCPGVSFLLVSGPASGEVLESGFYTIEFEATDAAGNTTTCTFTATLTEETPPVFTCPGDIAATTDPGSCEAIVNFDAPIATDDCSDVTVTQTGGPVSGSSFPIGSTAVEFTAEDASGNTTICTFNIVVTDQVDPEIICPEDITADNDPGLCGATITYDLPTGTDDCGPVTIQLINGLGAGAFFPVGTQTETYEVIDESGNTSTCSFDITVSDSEAPVLDCPGDILVENIPDGDCDAVVNYPLPTATDNCTSANITLTEGLASGSVFPVGSTTVSFDAIDDAGNIATCSFVVTVTENVIPEITCPADITVENDPGACGTIVTYTAPIGTDNCGNEVTTLSSGLGSGATFPVGTTTEEYTVTDLSGNTATCSFTVTVTDVELPILTCPANITVSSDPDQCEAVVNFDPPTVTDNCDDALIPVQTAGPVSGSAFPVGTTTVTFEATDLAGNVSTCSFDVTVTDQVAPEITCPADIVAVANDGDCEAVVNYPDPTATDNCTIPTITLIDGLASGSVFPVGVTTVTFEATDGNGNSATCSFTVTVSEAVPPTITCPADITTDNDPGSCGAIVNYDLPSATDGCGDVTITLIEGLASGNLFPVGATTVTYEATDLSGNTAQCSFTVTVNDVEAPVFECPAELILTTDAGSCEAVYTFDLPTATDNCTGDLAVVQTEGPTSGTSLGLGATTFAFATTDDAGNTTTCTYNVVVSDSEAPVFTSCPEDISLAANEADCTALAEYATPEATDNCSAVIEQTAGPISGSSLEPGVYTVEFTATDPSGNISTCTFQIDVLDDVAPEIISCPEPITTCDAIVEFDAPVALDNCSDVTVTQTSGPASGTQFPVGITTVSFELSDASGNVAICTFDVEVLQAATRPEAGGDQNICDETEATLNGNAPGFGTGTWSQLSGQGNIASPNTPQTLVTDLGVGSNVFIWTIDPGNGCDALSDTTLVIVEPNVTADAGPDQIILAGGQVAINASATPPGGDALWTPSNSLSCLDCLNPVASPTETTTYTLTYTSPLGCERTDSATVRVTREFPNTITPDGDGVNDVWNIPGLDDFPNVEVVIYNRWGNEIFQSTGYIVPWDGTNNGEDLPTGSYYYIIDYKSPGIENVNGTVNIIR